MQDRELVCKDRSGKFHPLFKKQGSLDGACATYSVVMNLLILGVIYESDTRVNAEHKSRTTKKLFKVFCNDYGMHRDGQTFYKIKRMLNESFASIITTEHKLTENQDSVDYIVECIDNDIPVIISISASNFAHAMLAVGYETQDDVPSRILCLDPSGDYIRGRKRWNAEIGLSQGRKTVSYSTVAEGIPSISFVHLDDILILTKVE